MIVLSGKKRSGKDTVAHMLKLQGFKTYALADPIKDALYHGFKRSIYTGIITRDMLNGLDDYDREQSLHLTINEVRDVLIEAVFYTFEDAGFSASYYIDCLDSIVEFLQKLDNPTEFSIRKFMQTLGTDIVCNIISDQHWLNLAEKKAPDNAVITDVRQPWEETYYRNKNATFVFVTGAYAGYVKPTDKHITERGLTPRPHDIVIINDTFEHVKEQIECLTHNLQN